MTIDTDHGVNDLFLHWEMRLCIQIREGISELDLIVLFHLQAQVAMELCPMVHSVHPFHIISTKVVDMHQVLIMVTTNSVVALQTRQGPPPYESSYYPRGCLTVDLKLIYVNSFDCAKVEVKVSTTNSFEGRHLLVVENCLYLDTYFEKL